MFSSFLNINNDEKYDLQNTTLLRYACDMFMQYGIMIQSL